MTETVLALPSQDSQSSKGQTFPQTVMTRVGRAGVGEIRGL